MEEGEWGEGEGGEGEGEGEGEVGEGGSGTHGEYVAGRLADRIRNADTRTRDNRTSAVGAGKVGRGPRIKGGDHDFIDRRLWCAR
jgi:hypothetical protein